MQASVHEFHEAAGTGSVITDDGVLLPFDLGTFLRSGLRRLRVGQRLSVLPAEDGTSVVELWLESVGRRPGH